MRPLRPGAGASAPTLPLRYMVTASLAFVLAAAGTVWFAAPLSGHYYQPRVVALVHTVTLGWITLTIMGASYQLIPIVLERPIWSERLARWQFVILSAGIAGMLAHFYNGTWPGLALAAGVVAVGATVHLINALASLRAVKVWSFTARLLAVALAGLALTVLFGLGLAADRIWKFLPGGFFPTLHAHFHLGLLGWVAPMILGVAARVYPMFLLARDPKGWPGALQLWGLPLGGAAVVLGLLAVPVLVIPGALGVAAAAVGHLVWVAGMVANRKRPALDWGLRCALTGTAFLVPTGIMGLGFAGGLLAGPRLALAYGVLALGGWASLTIVGMLFKIVPFLVWYRVYGPLVGKAPVPTLAQLPWALGESLTHGFLSVGVAALAVAVGAGDPLWIGTAGAIVTLGALAFALSLGRVLRHLAPSRRTGTPATTLGLSAL
ncbi:MAG: hypothetical protein HYV93_20465 [Candidatus Rokubacteria bacterium]|nr:hypothetical protein [Candidatus Rokubacteria bacterium]